MEKLYECFRIEKVMICGGGAANWSFLQAGVIDELSLFLAPVSDGSRGEASVFTQIPSLNEGGSVELLLKDIEKIGDGGLRLNYRVKKAEQN